ncbi:MAG: GspE/PulE family protein [bacterium]|nr:GspE/PulE family protein [bacterium]
MTDSQTSQNSAELQAKLTRLKRDGEERAAQRLAQKSGHTYVDLTRVPAVVDAMKLIPENIARDAKIAAIEIKARGVAVAVLNPELPATKKAVRDLEEQKYKIKIFIASQAGLDQAWRLYRFVKPKTEAITGKVNIEEKQIKDLMRRLIDLDSVRREIDGLDFAKITPTALVEIILGGALSLRASDIHLEAEEKKAKIRFRIDGLLHDAYDNLPKKNYEVLISRIKLLAGLKINVKNEAQDGRFAIGLGEKEIEIRVSIIPTEFGETIVMRILDPDIIAISLHDLGLREDDMVIVERQITKPNGLILNTGPTGSGKTTTLYAFLRKINDPEMKIITLEDPIEYRIEGIEQTQVNNETDYTFANGLRAIVRQDPDVILVGEVRDLDTADVALQAALTGHMVLSTLHTNDAIGAVPRLINLGVKAVSIGAAVTLIIAQRLVRKLCPKCKKAAQIPEDLKSKIKKLVEKLPVRVDRLKYKNIEVYEPLGCPECGGIGYRGRIGIFEFLEGGLDLEEIILKEASEISLKKLADKQGMVTMQKDGILKILAGETSFEEVESATGKIEWTN